MGVEGRKRDYRAFRVFRYIFDAENHRKSDSFMVCPHGKRHDRQWIVLFYLLYGVHQDFAAAFDFVVRFAEKGGLVLGGNQCAGVLFFRYAGKRVCDDCSAGDISGVLSEAGAGENDFRGCRHVDLSVILQ